MNSKSPSLYNFSNCRATTIDAGTVTGKNVKINSHCPRFYTKKISHRLSLFFRKLFFINNNGIYQYAKFVSVDLLNVSVTALYLQ